MSEHDSASSRTGVSTAGSTGSSAASGARRGARTVTQAQGGPPGPGGTALRVVAAVATMLAAAFSASVPEAVPGFQDLGDRLAGSGTAAGAVASDVLLALECSLATVVAVLACLLLLGTLDRGRGLDLGLRPGWRALAWMLAMVAAAVVVVGLAACLAQVLGVQGSVQQRVSDSLPGEVLTALAMGFLLQGVPEEVIWRGWLLPSLGSTRTAAWVSVLGFTVLHLASSTGLESPSLVQRLAYLAVPFGLAVAAVAARTVSGSTWAAVGVHGGMHLASTLVAPRLEAPAAPAAWLVLGALWLLVGAAVLGLGRRWAARQPGRRTR